MTAPFDKDAQHSDFSLAQAPEAGARLVQLAGMGALLGLGGMAGRRMGRAFGRSSMKPLRQQIQLGERNLANTQKTLSAERGSGALATLGLMGAGGLGATAISRQLNKGKKPEDGQDQQTSYKFSADQETVEAIIACAIDLYKHAAEYPQDVTLDKVAALAETPLQEELVKEAYRMYDELQLVDKLASIPVSYLLAGAGGGAAGAGGLKALKQYMGYQQDPDLSGGGDISAGVAGTGMGIGALKGYRENTGDLPRRLSEIKKTTEGLQSQIQGARSVRGGAKSLQTSIGRLLGRFL